MRAKLWRRTREGVVCQLCYRFCKLKEGERGYCRVRYVKNGELHTLTYGNLSAIENRPMEIKPFFHFLPGESVLTFSTYSCNLDCPWCQNWHISKVDPPMSFDIIPPETLVSMTDTGLCASFNEPTLLFEYLLDAFSMAKRRGLVNTMVSNGYISPIALKMLGSAGLDAMNVDVKGDERVYEKYVGGKVRNVWRTIKLAYELGIHVEVVCLIITEVNDNEAFFEDVAKKLAKICVDIPLHFTRYFPAYMFRNPPTPVETLERAIDIAKNVGLRFVYIGNVPGHRCENTYCPECGRVLIRRHSYRIVENRLKDGYCPFCGERIYGVWNRSKTQKH